MVEWAPNPGQVALHAPLDDNHAVRDRHALGRLQAGDERDLNNAAGDQSGLLRPSMPALSVVSVPIEDDGGLHNNSNHASIHRGARSQRPPSFRCFSVEGRVCVIACRYEKVHSKAPASRPASVRPAA